MSNTSISKFRIRAFLAGVGFALLMGGFATADDAAKKESKPEEIDVFGVGSISVPGDFKRVQPKSRIIQHEFKVTADGESTPARLTMMGASGGVEANIKRWKGQFTGGDPDKQKSEEVAAGDWKVHIVDCSGEYAERMGGGPFAPGKTVMRKDYAMAGAILVEPKGRTFFVKMIGPAKVVDANRKAFVTMVKSVGK